MASGEGGKYQSPPRDRSNSEAVTLMNTRLSPRPVTLLSGRGATHRGISSQMSMEKCMCAAQRDELLELKEHATQLPPQCRTCSEHWSSHSLKDLL